MNSEIYLQQLGKNAIVVFVNSFCIISTSSMLFITCLAGEILQSQVRLYTTGSACKFVFIFFF